VVLTSALHMPFGDCQGRTWETRAQFRRKEARSYYADVPDGDWLAEISFSHGLDDLGDDDLSNPTGPARRTLIEAKVQDRLSR
jgi:hypothetical protein